MCFLKRLVVGCMYLTGVFCCNIDICLTWNVTDHELELWCQVSNLSFTVEFKNPSQDSPGHCVLPKPVPLCHGNYKNVFLTQNPTTNVTIMKLTGNIDASLNGGWKCIHGTKTDEATVNVTILKQERLIIKNTCNQWMIAAIVIEAATIVIILIYCCRKLRRQT